jgi:hypothetical protein
MCDKHILTFLSYTLTSGSCIHVYIRPACAIILTEQEFRLHKIGYHKNAKHNPHHTQGLINIRCRRLSLTLVARDCKV